MNIVENIEARCEARNETPCYALEHAGLSKSFLSKLRKFPDRVPSGESLAKLAVYFGCTVDDLIQSKPYERSTTAIKIQSLVDKMSPDQQEYLFRLIQFIVGESK